MDWDSWSRRDPSEPESAEDTVMCVHAAWCEIDNGGFAQLFTNTTGDRSAAIIVALERIGALKVARLMREAVEELFVGMAPRDCEAREDVLWGEGGYEKTEKVMNRLDEEFYAESSQQELTSRFYGFAAEEGILSQGGKERAG